MPFVLPYGVFNQSAVSEHILIPGLDANYSSISLVRGFRDEIFWPSKPRTAEEPRTGEGLRKVDIWTTFELQQVIWWP